MTQSQLPLSPRAKVAHHAVPESSREAYHEASKCWRERFVLTSLDRFHPLVPATAAEIASHVGPIGEREGFLQSPEFKLHTLNVRRALSDLQADGRVIACESRVCRITGRKVITWRLKQY